MVHDAVLAFEPRLSIRGLRGQVGYIVKARSYAPSMELNHRGKHLGVLQGQLLTVQSAARVVGQPLPRPTRDVPPFCQWIEPRVDGLEDALVAALRSMSTTVDDEGNIIE